MLARSAARRRSGGREGEGCRETFGGEWPRRRRSTEGFNRFGACAVGYWAELSLVVWVWNFGFESEPEVVLVGLPDSRFMFNFLFLFFFASKFKGSNLITYAVVVTSNMLMD
jgi:hypothetical protein